MLTQKVILAQEQKVWLHFLTINKKNNKANIKLRPTGCKTIFQNSFSVSWRLIEKKKEKKQHFGKAG